MGAVVYFLATDMTIAEHDSPYIFADRAHRLFRVTRVGAALLLVMATDVASAQDRLTPPASPVTVDYGALDRLPGAKKPQGATRTPSAERPGSTSNRAAATRFSPPPPPPKFEEPARGASAIRAVERTTPPPPPALLPSAPPPPKLASPSTPPTAPPAAAAIATTPAAAPLQAATSPGGVAEVDAATPPPPPPPPSLTGRTATTASRPSAPAPVDPPPAVQGQNSPPVASPAPRTPAPATAPPAAPAAVADEPKVTPAPRVPVESAPAGASTPQATPPPRTSAPQVAARPPTGVIVDGAMLRLEFASGSAELSDTARDALAWRAETFKRDETARIQVQAFATGSGGSEPRRLSLSRALAVRAFFVERGIAGSRIDVRALGERSDDGPSERVDIVTVRR